MELRSVSLRVRDTENSLGSSGDGPVYPAYHWLWYSPRRRRRSRPVRDVGSGDPRPASSKGRVSLVMTGRNNGGRSKEPRGSDHRQPRCPRCWPRLELALLEHRQPLPQEQILSNQRRARRAEQTEEGEQMRFYNSQNSQSDRSDSTARIRAICSRNTGQRSLAEIHTSFQSIPK